VKSASAGGQHDLTSEVHQPGDPVPKSDSIIADAAVPAPMFVCSHTNVGLDAAWVHVAGELDIATTPQLERTLSEAELQARLVALDLRDVSFMDCAGLHTIISASIRARQCGHRLVLLRGPPNVERMFTLTGTTAAVEIADVDPGEPPVQALQQLADAG
jgi:anti-anti-sigma factor